MKSTNTLFFRTTIKVICITLTLFYNSYQGNAQALTSDSIVMKKNRNIKNQFYMLAGKGEMNMDYNVETQKLNTLHGEIGGIFYLNKKKAKHLFYGLNWTLLSADLINERSVFAGTQLGPELSVKLTKGIVISSGYQYRYGAIVEDISSLSLDGLYQAHTIHASCKIGPLISKVEWQSANLPVEDYSTSISNLTFSVGLSF